MSNYLKKALQKLLVQRRHRLYEERIAEQAVPYGVWTEKLLEEEKADILRWKEEAAKWGKQRLSVSVLTWQGFCDALSGGEKAQDMREDLWIVTKEPSYLAEEAAAEAERYFLEHPACGIAYGDEAGYFKPGWSPDLLQSFFYFGNVFVVRRALAERVREKVERAENFCGGNLSGAVKVYGEGGVEKPGGEDAAKGTVQERLYGLVLYCIDEAKEAGHIEKILFLPDAQFDERDWGMEPEFDGIKKGHLYSDAEIPEEKERQELVSVIIPSKDNPAVLSNCIHSLREQTAYQNVEIVVVDNGSDDKNRKKILQMQHQLKEEYSFRYIYMPMDFNFSAMCNLGAKEAAGNYLLFLNDDMEIAREDWLSVMMSKAAKRYVGAVGAKLLYPDSDKIQHLGITNIHLGPAHKLQFSSDKKAYYHGINRCAVNVSAVTGACLLIRREVFEEIGGFDERLEVAFNDVELCFRLLRAGYKNVCCNQTFLYHHESLSRGFDAGEEKVARLHRERDLLYAAYPEMWNRDLYYSGRLVTDILDRGYEPACRFEEKRLSERGEVIRLEGELDPVWYNECLYMGLEFTGDESAWKTGRSGGGDYYIQGWSYAVSVDNSRYEKSLLMKAIRLQDRQDEQGENEERLWKIPYRECYRPDFQENLPYIDHPALSGVSVWIGRDALPKGEYLIGYLWEDMCSRQKLCGFSAETLRVE